jgi:site-specific DNA recombinase
VVDLDDPALKDRIAGLKATRDQAQADAERAQAMPESSSQQAITSAMVRKFAWTARERMRIEGGGYRRDHLRALAQRVEVTDKATCSGHWPPPQAQSQLLPGVRSSVLKWRMGWDSNPREACTPAGFQDRCLKPLGHPSPDMRLP